MCWEDCIAAIEAVDGPGGTRLEAHIEAALAELVRWRLS